MFLYAHSARRPASHPSATLLSPIFRERYLSALARVQPARANHLSIKAAECKEETLVCGLKELSTTTIDTAHTIGTSSGELSSPFDEARAIEADLGAFGENSTLPAEVVSLPSIPASNTRNLTYPLSNPMYAALKGLERDLIGGNLKEPVELTYSIPRLAQPAPDTIEPVLDIAASKLNIPVSIATETVAKPFIPSSFKDALPLDKDTEFTIIDHDIDTPSTPTSNQMTSMSSL